MSARKNKMRKARARKRLAKWRRKKCCRWVAFQAHFVTEIAFALAL